MSSFSSLTEEALIHCYRMAVKLNLDADFIRMISNELEKRKLSVKDLVNSELPI